MKKIFKKQSIRYLKQTNRSRFSSVLKVNSPYTNETVYEVATHSIEESVQKLDQANQKQKMFSKSSIEYRIDLMNEAKNNLKQRQDEICEHVSNSMGKPLKQS